MKKLVITAVIVVPVFVLATLFAYVLYNGPRMTVQPHVRAYQMVAPLPPEGTVTVESAPRPVADGARNPLPATAENLHRGSVYYRYYCIFCHGERGVGNGPVGESYVPVPTDLRTPKVQGYDDGRLLRAMLTGIGHEPVLERVVPPQHRWYVVLYVRDLGKK